MSNNTTSIDDDNTLKRPYPSEAQIIAENNTPSVVVKSSASSSAKNARKKQRQNAAAASPTTDPTILGLRYYALRLCQYVKSKRVTSYQLVADHLVDDAQLDSITDKNKMAAERKNVRRRVYDALNVLLAAQVIDRREDKTIRWIGFPPTLGEIGSSSSVATIDDEIRQERIGARRADIAQLALAIIGVRSLIDRNRQADGGGGRPSSHEVMQYLRVGDDNMEELPRFVEKSGSKLPDIMRQVDDMIRQLANARTKASTSSGLSSPDSALVIDDNDRFPWDLPSDLTLPDPEMSRSGMLGAESSMLPPSDPMSDFVGVEIKYESRLRIELPPLRPPPTASLSSSRRLCPPLLLVVAPLTPSAQIECRVAQDKSEYDIRMSERFTIYDELDLFGVMSTPAELMRTIASESDEREEAMNGALQYLPGRERRVILAILAGVSVQ